MKVCLKQSNNQQSFVLRIIHLQSMVSQQNEKSTHKFPQIGNLPVTLHTLTLLLHQTPMGAAEERNRVHMEQFPSGNI